MLVIHCDLLCLYWTFYIIRHVVFLGGLLCFPLSMKAVLLACATVVKSSKQQVDHEHCTDVMLGRYKEAAVMWA